MKVSSAALVVVAAAVVALVSCGEPQTYGADDVRGAFEKNGFPLFSPPEDAAVRAASQLWGSGLPVILMPRSGESFVVFVGRFTDAEEVWSRYESQQNEETFDARRANVIVISDSGLDRTQRLRITAALASLPDRGSPVEVAGG